MTLADLHAGQWFRFDGDDRVMRLANVFDQPVGDKFRRAWIYCNATLGCFGDRVPERKARKLAVVPLAFIDAPLFATTEGMKR